MKYLVLLALIGGGYYFYMDSNKQTLERPYGSYDINNLSQNPIPKAAQLEGDKFYAKSYACNEIDFQKFSSKSAAECQSYVESNHETCKIQSLLAMPDLAYSKEEIEINGKPYLNCVLPKRG
jgi:hypothetical protein